MTAISSGPKGGPLGMGLAAWGGPSVNFRDEHVVFLCLGKEEPATALTQRGLTQRGTRKIDRRALAEWGHRPMETPKKRAPRARMAKRPCLLTQLSLPRRPTCTLSLSGQVRLSLALRGLCCRSGQAIELLRGFSGLQTSFQPFHPIREKQSALSVGAELFPTTRLKSCFSWFLFGSVPALCGVSMAFLRSTRSIQAKRP
jgi:hypothetical protein